MSTTDVLFFEHPGQDGSVVAQAHLNVPTTLNALTLDAVEAMTPKMLINLFLQLLNVKKEEIFLVQIRL